MFTSGHVAKDGILGPWSCAVKRLYTVTLIDYTLVNSSGGESVSRIREAGQKIRTVKSPEKLIFPSPMINSLSVPFVFDFDVLEGARLKSATNSFLIARGVVVLITI